MLSQVATDGGAGHLEQCACMQIPSVTKVTFIQLQRQLQELQLVSDAVPSHLTSFFMLHFIIELGLCLGVALQLVVIPKVEWLQLHESQGTTKEMDLSS